MLWSGAYAWFREGIMVLEECTYTIKPGQIPGFLAIYEREGLSAQRRHLGQSVGWSTSEFGNSIRSSNLRAWTTAPSGVRLSMGTLSGKPSFQKPLSSSRSKRIGYCCLRGSRRCAEGWQRQNQLVALASASGSGPEHV